MVCVQCTVLGQKTTPCYKNTVVHRVAGPHKECLTFLEKWHYLVNPSRIPSLSEVAMCKLNFVCACIQKFRSFTKSRHDSKLLSLIRWLQINVFVEFISILHWELDLKFDIVNINIHTLTRFIKTLSILWRSMRHRELGEIVLLVTVPWYTRSNIIYYCCFFIFCLKRKKRTRYKSLGVELHFIQLRSKGLI